MQQYVRKVDASGHAYVETDLSGYMLTRSPLLNKGTAFTIEERKELGLLGTLPPHVTPLAEQVQQSYANFSNFQTPLDKHVFLRMLQDRIVRKVGSNVETQVDVRVIAATNRDLNESIRAGSFREDLFYRINVIPIALPALRQRREDIPLLVDHFITKYSKNMGVPLKRISADAMRALDKYGWPGNVRELENVVERMIALESSEVLTTKSLPEHVLLGSAIPELTYELPADGMSLEHHLEAIAKIYMLKALERTGGVQTQAAELLQMSFRSFRYYAKKYELIAREKDEVVELENEK